MATADRDSKPREGHPRAAVLFSSTSGEMPRRHQVESSEPRFLERVCFAAASWQLVTLCASIRAHQAAEPGSPPVRTTLVLGGNRISEAMRATLRDLAVRFPVFDRVCWIDGLVEDLAELDDVAFAERFARFREATGVESADEVWLTHPFTSPDRVLLEAYPAARVILFEDGLLTYARPWTETGSVRARLRETVRAAVRWLRRDPRAQVKTFHTELRLLGRPVRRPHATYLILGNHIRVPDVYRDSLRLVRPELLRGVVDELRTGPGESPRTDRPRALVVGSSFSYWKAMTREEELALYVGVVARVAAAGYHVSWKDHPRVLAPFLPELRRLLPEVEILPFSDDHTLPLEVVLLEEPVDLVVAAMSSSLIYVPLLFGERIRVATFAEAVRPLVHWTRLRMADLILSVVPRLDVALRDPEAGVLAGPTRAAR
jgi:hypothetical protein